MKKFFPLCAVLLVAAGCQGGLKTATWSDEQVLPLQEGRADSLMMSISLEYPVKRAAEDVRAQITRGILGAAFDLEEEPGTVEETALRYEDYLKDEYYTENEKYLASTQTDGILSWEDRINGYFSGRWGHYVSYMVEYYNFRGGAHGINTMTPIIFDVRTGEVVPEEEFFADNYRTPVAGCIQAHLDEALEGDEESIAAIFEPDLVGPNGNYEITKDGVTWYYQPYDIAPYSVGVISVSVPWKELKEWVRE